jgi:hypothetical protein
MVIRLRDMKQSVFLLDGLSARGLRFISYLQMENEITSEDVIFYRKLKHPLNHREIGRLNGYFEKVVNKKYFVNHESKVKHKYPYGIRIESNMDSIRDLHAADTALKLTRVLEFHKHRCSKIFTPMDFTSA